MSERSPLLSARHSSRSLASSHVDVKSKNAIEDASSPGLSVVQGFIVATGLFVLIFILTFGISIITTTQSSVARDLHVTTGASWMASSYLIAVTSVTPISGKFCKIFSLRSYLLVSTFIQAAGLLVTAFSGSFTTFILGRVICGIGSAAVTPVTFLTVTEYSAERHRGIFFGLINCAYTTGVAIGAVVGGALDPLIGWRAIFWSQAPVCLFTGVVVFSALPAQSSVASSDSEQGQTLTWKLARIDYLGVVTLIGAIVALLYTLASPSLELISLAVAIALAALFSWNESRWAAEPIIPSAIICSRAVACTGLATLGQMCSRWEVLFYTPTFGIAVLGWTQSQSGLFLVSTNLGFGIGSVLVGIIHIKQSRSYYISCLVCLAAFAVEQLALSRLILPGTSIWLFVIALFGNGFIAGALLNYSLIHVLYLTDRSHHVIVIPLVALFRSLSGSIGAALSGGIFVRALRMSLQNGFRDKGIHGNPELISQLLSRPMLVQSLQGMEREVAVSSYATSIRYLVTLGCTWVVVTMLVQAGTGWTGPEEQVTNKTDRGEAATTDTASTA